MPSQGPPSAGHGADDPLAYMTSDGPSPYTYEARFEMMSLFFSRGRRASGWHRGVVVALRLLAAAFLVGLAIGVGNAVYQTLR